MDAGESRSIATDILVLAPDRDAEARTGDLPRGGGAGGNEHEGFWLVNPGTRRICVWLVPDEAGGFTAESPMLVGVVSEGDDDRSALEGFREACEAALAEYAAADITVPWNALSPRAAPPIQERWIVVRG